MGVIVPPRTGVSASLRETCDEEKVPRCTWCIQPEWQEFFFFFEVIWIMDRNGTSPVLKLLNYVWTTWSSVSEIGHWGRLNAIWGGQACHTFPTHMLLIQSSCIGCSSGQSVVQTISSELAAYWIDGSKTNHSVAQETGWSRNSWRTAFVNWFFTFCAYTASYRMHHTSAHRSYGWHWSGHYLTWSGD